VRLYVRTAAPTFTVTAYRTGFYGGVGARRIWASPTVRATTQPEPVVHPATRTVDCSHWSPSLALEIDETWPPGQYVLKLVPAAGLASYVPLIVRDDDRHADVVVISDVTTVQAYNAWGGFSLYGDEVGDPARRATVVSFDRPYGTGWAQVGSILGDTFNVGMQLESMGLDVSYITNVDEHQRPDLLAHHRLIVSGAHDEYYSLEMRKGLEAARNRGVNVVFLGANAVYRRIRFAGSPLGEDRRQINYRSARADPLHGIDPQRVTTNWRDNPDPRPESSLTGTYYESNQPGLTAPMVVVDAAAWMFEGTRVTDGQRWPGMIREEYDRVTPGAPTPQRIQVLTHSPLVCRGTASHADMAYYTVPSGAGVLGTGTLRFEPHLGPLGDPRQVHAGHPDRQIRKLMANVFTTLAGGPAGHTHPAEPNLERLGITR
jgi:N,N-dimethylformamidase beta subunit-like, C-terminal